MTEQSQSRFRGSVAVALLLYGSLTAAVVAASAAVKKVVQEKETRVEFAPPPEPEPPPEPVKQEAAPPSPSPRPKVKRQVLAPPDKVSDEKLKESDKELAAAGEGGPVDGFLDGTPGGKGTAPAPPPPPPPKQEPLIGATDSGGNERPSYPPSAKRKGIEGSVVVMFDVLENGTVANPQIVSGPVEFHEFVLRAVRAWHYKPAHRGGVAVRTRVKKTIVFRLEDA